MAFYEVYSLPLMRIRFVFQIVLPPCGDKGMRGGTPHGPNNYSMRANIEYMQNKHKKTVFITDSGVWDGFTDSLVVSVVFIGLLAFAASFREVQLYGYPAGTCIAFTFAMLATKGRTGGFRDETVSVMEGGDMVFHTLLGGCMGLLLSLFGNLTYVPSSILFLGAVLLPISVTHPLLSADGEGMKHSVRTVFRPTFPHLILWVAELGCNSMLSGFVLGFVCSGFEAASGWISARMELETQGKTKRFVNTMIPASMTVSVALLLIQYGMSAKACVMAILGAGAGLIAGKAISTIPVIQIAAGVGVASFISFLGYVNLGF